MLPLSIFDLAPVSEGATPAQGLQNARDLAQHAERLGYRRYWVAEHHNMVGIASAATAVVDCCRWQSVDYEANYSNLATRKARHQKYGKEATPVNLNRS
jgi:hypothetical protein